MSLLLVSHDISIVAGMSERVGVMYAGQLVECGPTAEVLYRPRHPYTRALIESLPESAGEGLLPTIPGSPPEPGHFPDGCAFAPRCPLATRRVPCCADPARTRRRATQLALHPRRPARRDAAVRGPEPRPGGDGCRLTCSCRSRTSGRPTANAAAAASAPEAHARPERALPASRARRRLAADRARARSSASSARADPARARWLAASRCSNGPTEAVWSSTASSSRRSASGRSGRIAAGCRSCSRIRTRRSTHA